MAEPKVCALCNKIITNRDNYVRLTDYLEGKKFKECFYHNKCYHDRIGNVIAFNKEVLKKQARQIIPALMGKKVYDIK